MKKFISVLLSAIMAACVMTVSVAPAMAAPTFNSPTGKVEFSPILLINGSSNYTGISFFQSESDPYTYTFVYNGEGTLTGWEYNLQELGFVSGTDYVATENEDGSLTITFVSDTAKAAIKGDDVVVNAIVDLKDTGKDTGKDKNDSKKAPATGIATSAVAGTAALAMAGLAVLSAKKKDAE